MRLGEQENWSDADLLSLIPIPEQRPGHSSLFVFSFVKCGSTMLTNMMEDALSAAGKPHVNIPRIFFHSGVPPEVWRTRAALRQIISPGMSYVGFRALPEFLTTEMLVRSKSVVLLRDPRDALVSAYFSFGPGGSHPLPGKGKGAWAKKMTSKRAADSGTTIDDWVLRRAPHFCKEFMRYSACMGAPYMKLFRYEDVVFRKEQLLEDIFGYFDLRLPENAAAIAKRHDIIPLQEDPSRHIRKATPGDHLEKLQPETIAELDRILRDPLNVYGYSHGS